MYWKNLIKNKCPRCGHLLGFDQPEGKPVILNCHKCNFKISGKKALDIINNVVRGELADIEEKEEGWG